MTARAAHALVATAWLLAMPVAAHAQQPAVNGHGAQQPEAALERERAALRDTETRNQAVRAELERLRRALQSSDAEIEQILQRIERLQRDLGASQ